MHTPLSLEVLASMNPRREDAVYTSGRDGDVFCLVPGQDRETHTIH
jgi:hypothetical protein